MLVDGHQVVGLAPGFWELLLQELVEGSQVVEAPVLSRMDFTEVAAEIDEADVAFLTRGCFPRQDLVD
jgi:hypothetical protein